VPTSPILGTIVAYVIGIVLIPTGIAGFAVFMTLATVSLSVCAAEGAGAGASLRIAWRRCFSRSQIRRTVAVGMAWIAPLFAIAIALAFFRSALTFGPTIEPILRVVLQIPVFVIGYAWTTVFSLDARIRSEGYDLEIATLAGSPSEIITT
jgi:ABC-type Fe3+ transport system permease subunit